MSAKQTILITGANGALGHAIAKCFLEDSQDNFVWLGVRTNRTRADELAAQFSESCRVVELQVTDRASWKTALATIRAAGSPPSVLVNNAGGHDDGLLAHLTDEKWTNVIDANLNSTYLGSQEVLNDMVAARFGRIINISSLSGLLAPMGQTNYAAAKAGVIAFTQSLAKEVARIGITVNAICPGHIGAEELGTLSEEAKNLAQKIPMRRLGRPSEVAAAVKFLASSDASYITGAVLKIDGGIL